MPGIIWLASYPKSGNTWLRAFLANYLSDARKPVQINDLPNHILGDNLILHYEQFSGKNIEEIADREIAHLRPRIHQWFAATSKYDAFVKTHNALIQVDGVPLITPAATAGAIYVARNPMDLAISFAHHYQVEYARAVKSLCEDNYCLPSSSGILPQYLTSWSGHVRSWTEAPGLTSHVMRYEDMEKDPVRSFGRLTKFLGIRKEAGRLRRAIKFSSFSELSTQEKSSKFVESRPDGLTPFFRSGKTGTWRELLSEDQVETLISHHREVMTKLSYLQEDGELTV